MRKLFLAAMAAMALGAAAEPALSSGLDSIFFHRYADDSPGAAVLIAVGDNIIYERYFGMADMGTHERITADTRFNIASISKQFSAVAVLQLQAEGKVDIDKPVATYFPRFKAPFWQRVTLRHMMSHSSGVPDARDRSDHRRCVLATDKESVSYFDTLSYLKFDPGTAYDYINPTFTLLGKLIENISGEEFEEYQYNHLFKPGGISDICYFVPERYIPNMAHGYIVNDGQSAGESDNGSSRANDVATEGVYRDHEGRQWVEYDFGEETFFATRPDGGIYATARAMFQWERALQNGRLLKPELLGMARSPITTVTGSKWCSYQNRPDTFYGLGWFIDRTPDRETKIYHTGDNGGFQAYLATYPASGVTVVTLENRNDYDRWSTQLKVERLLRDFGVIH